MRFTKKSGYHYYAYGIKEKENKNGSKRQYGNPITKLGKLEDVEELCVKMTAQPIYEKHKDIQLKLDFAGSDAAYDFKNNCIIVYKGCGETRGATIYSVNEYGKTWAFTPFAKEELK